MIDGAGGVYRIVTDHLGSVRLVYRVSNGGVVEQMSYGIFGLPDNGWGRAVPFGFAGGLWDSDLGMLRFGARDMDPYKGRWVTKDRSRFGGGLNFYQYGSSDPVNYIDADGKNPILLFGGLVAAWAFWALNSPTHDGSVVVGGAYMAGGLGMSTAGGAAGAYGLAVDASTALNEASLAEQGLAGAGAAGAICEAESELVRNNLSASNAAVEHVLSRHAFGSTSRNAGKFASSADIPGLIRSTVANGSIRPGNSGGPSRYVFEHVFDGPVGVNRAGQDAFNVRVVLEPDGSLVTAFPY